MSRTEWQPANHTLTVTLPEGKTARGQVFYLQPKVDRWREERAEAIYNTPAESLAGTFTVYSYTSEADLWRFVGTFERAAVPRELGTIGHILATASSLWWYRCL